MVSALCAALLALRTALLLVPALCAGMPALRVGDSSLVVLS
ncbi:hypothetical protein A2U01_0116228 [Trifolium medium]|uniref:Uncharacterized protein n=1 Tax=Trifolium medium TaxID=97028 RepID=A0A392W8B3_9FABA|nr:hypothetical protein [Trifolium medium]